MTGGNIMGDVNVPDISWSLPGTLAGKSVGATYAREGGQGDWLNRRRYGG
jgi:hypothetical protein